MIIYIYIHKHIYIYIYIYTYLYHQCSYYINIYIYIYHMYPMTLSRQERALALLATALGMLCGAIFTSIVTNDISDIRRIQRLHSDVPWRNPRGAAVGTGKGVMGWMVHQVGKLMNGNSNLTLRGLRGLR